MSQRDASDLVRPLDNIRPQSVKAGLTSDFIGPVSVMHEAIIDFYGTVKEAAYWLGLGANQPKLDESLMQREFKAGDFKRLRFASPECCAAVSKAMFLAYGLLAQTPEQHTESLIDRIQADLNEVRQYVRSAK